jgi:hypothetical protein
VLVIFEVDQESRTFFMTPSDPLVGIEQLLVLVEREAVGHAGDVVGDHARLRLPSSMRRWTCGGICCGSSM